MRLAPALALVATIAGAPLAAFAADEEPTTIHAVSLRGGTVTQLALGDGALADPAWSRDGRKVLFSAYPCEGCPPQIKVATLGRHSAPLRIATGVRPRWSPDGRTVAYVATSGAVELVGADGKHQRRLARVGLSDDSPSWAPDGRRIAFSAQLPGGKHVLFSVGADGGGLRRLAAGADPAWSPNGRTIAFAQVRPNGTWHLYSVSAAGGRPRWIGAAAGETDVGGGSSSPSDTQPAWSPDGRRIAFTRHFAGASGAVHVMPAGGGAARRVTPAMFDAIDPAWSPDGSRIAFVARP